VVGNFRNSRKGRLRLTEMALAIETAIAADNGGPGAVDQAEKRFSAALLCVSTTAPSNYASRPASVSLMKLLQAELDSPERVAAFHNFLQQVGSRHTLPFGDGCT
jgi:hypothetical protein